MIDIRIFTAKNCPNCPSAKKVLGEVCKEFEGKVKVIEVDIEKEPEEALMFQVASTPSIAIGENTIFFGKVPNKEELKKEIEKALA